MKLNLTKSIQFSIGSTGVFRARPLLGLSATGGSSDFIVSLTGNSFGFLVLFGFTTSSVCSIGVGGVITGSSDFDLRYFFIFSGSSACGGIGTSTTGTTTSIFYFRGFLCFAGSLISV